MTAAIIPLDTAHDEPRVSSEVIAEHLSNQHKNTLALIRKNLPALQRFGLVAFQTRPRSEGSHGGGDIEYALLNEEQSFFLLALSKNTARVVTLKGDMVAAFSAAKKQVATSQPQPRISAAELLRVELSVAEMLGCSPEMGRVVAVKEVEDATGVSYAKYLTNNTVEEAPVNATELAKSYGVPSARAMNQILKDWGLQQKVGSEWNATPNGKPYSDCRPYTRTHNDQSVHSGFQLLWYPSKLKADFQIEED